MNTFLPFVTEEEVQVYIDEQDQAGRSGREALQRLLRSGCLCSQSESLALQWLAQHPRLAERRRRRTGFMGLAGRRSGEAARPRPFLRSMCAMGALVFAILALTPYFRSQTAFSPLDGGFDTPSAEARRAASDV